MREHDYVFLGFTALMVLLVMGARFLGRKGSPLHEPPIGGALEEFRVNFVKVIRPLGVVAVTPSVLLLIVSVDVAFKLFVLLGLAALTVALSFALFQLFRFKYPFLPYVGGKHVMWLVVIYVVFTLIYLSTFITGKNYG